ncbi:hypothetical protein JD844_005083, partial [Phrynosoma platyrhinos]
MDDGMSTIRIVDTDYDTYLIDHFQSEKSVFLNLLDINAIAIQLTGKWYPIAMIRADGIKEEMYAYTIEMVSNGDIVFLVEKLQKGRCKEIKINLHAIKKAFMTTSTKDVLRFMETDYKTYHITLARNPKTLALFLYARKKKVPEKVKKRLEKLASKYGFDPKSINYKPRVGASHNPIVILAILPVRQPGPDATTELWVVGLFPEWQQHSFVGSPCKSPPPTPVHLEATWPFKAPAPTLAEKLQGDLPGGASTRRKGDSPAGLSTSGIETLANPEYSMFTVSTDRLCPKGYPEIIHSHLDASGDLSTIHVVDTDYSGYLVLHTETAGNSALSLFARGLEVSESLKKKFEDYVRSLGFSKTDIKYLGQDDGGRNVTLDLSQVPPSEAREQLQDLMFGLVERIQALEKRLRQ